MMSRTRALATAYVLLSLVALLMIPASAYSWWGFEPDPLSGVFAIILAMPWAMGLWALDGTPTLLSLALLALCMGANLAIIIALGRWLRGRSHTE
jgi:hypothetical protein